jgi:tRNA (guanine37-N1)-methyltransferase
LAALQWSFATSRETLRGMNLPIHMKFDVITIFPDLIHHYASESILGRAQNAGHIRIRAHNLRDVSNNKWRHVDDKPYGGGPGMILQVEPIYKTLEKLKLVKNGKKINRTKTKVVIMDPAGN